MQTGWAAALRKQGWKRKQGWNGRLVGTRAHRGSPVIKPDVADVRVSAQVLLNREELRAGVIVGLVRREPTFEWGRRGRTTRGQLGSR